MWLTADSPTAQPRPPPMSADHPSGAVSIDQTTDERGDDDGTHAAKADGPSKEAARPPEGIGHRDHEHREDRDRHQGTRSIARTRRDREDDPAIVKGTPCARLCAQDREDSRCVGYVVHT